MNPFAVEQIWHAGYPVKVAERGSTLALLVEATVRRITAAATSPGGCPCCRCSNSIRHTADLRCVTVAVAHSNIEEYRVLVRAYCFHCASDTADAMAACEHGAMEQTRRLESRIDDERKIWKLSPMDLKSYSRWYDYSRARDEMFQATVTPWAPWYVIRSDDRGVRGSTALAIY